MTSLVIAAVVALLLTPLVKKVVPRGTLPPRIGGVAIAAAIVAGSLAAPAAGLAPYWIAIAVVFGMGLADDFLVLSPKVKLLFQVLGAALFLAFLGWSWWTPVFFLWLVGVTNSLNLLDNMDGLTPGVGAVAALFLYLLSPSPPLAALAGALIAFLLFNFFPARIYLGDAGSHLVGFTLAAIPLFGPKWHLAPLVLLVPIADTTFVAFTRVARGVSPFRGGKDHISHRLHRAGLPVPVVALLFYAVTAGLGVIAWLLR